MDHENYPANMAFDGDVRTYCHTENEAVNTLTLRFEESFVSDVHIVNRYSTRDIIDRLNGAKVKLMRGKVVRKHCGTIETLDDLVIRVSCGEAGSSLVIELANNFLHVAEVQIFGLG